MRVTIQQNLYVLEFESELRNVSLDLRCSLDESAIEQNMAVAGRDQERSDLYRADVIEVSDDLEWRHGFVLAPAGGIGLAKGGRRGEHTEGDEYGELGPAT